MNKYTSLCTNPSREKLFDDFYNTFIPSRTISPKAGISIYSINENMHKTLSTIIIPSKEDIFKFPEIIQTSLPSKKDFTNLLSKLDLVTSTKNVLNMDSVLNENEQLECVMEENTYHYIKIAIKGRKSPIRVFLKRIQGKVIVYSSIYNQKPSLANYDQVFTSDSFEIRSAEPYFKSDFLYLGIRALAYSKVTISSAFGKNRLIVPYERKKKKEETKEEHEDNNIKSLKKNSKNAASSRRFIEENLHRRMLSPTELVERNKIWLEKRIKALAKRKKKLEEKKDKALAFINRRQIRIEIAALERERFEAELKKENQLKTWLTFVFFAKSLKTLQEARIAKREQISARLTFNFKVRTIQKIYKKSSRHLTYLDLGIIRSYNILRLFNNICRPVIAKQNQEVIISTLATTGKRSKPIIVFRVFFHKVVTIQNGFRRYLEVRAERIRKLIIFWDEFNSFQTRRSFKRKSQIELNISIYQRTTVLNHYYIQCLKTFRTLMRNSRGIFLSEIQKDNKRHRQKIHFEFMPSANTMKKLIEAAYNVPDRSLDTERSK